MAQIIPFFINHPAFKSTNDDPLLNIMGMFASVGREPPMQSLSSEIEVEGDPHGIASGWFNHPWNFDPTWLVKCTGFEPTEEDQETTG